MKNKKIAFLSLLLLATAVTLTLFFPKNKVNTLEKEEAPLAENQTIQSLSKSLEGYTEEEVNAYFAGLDDDAPIIADSHGGIFSTLDKSRSTPVEIYDENGNVIERYAYDDPSVASTVGEVKEHLKAQRGD